MSPSSDAFSHGPGGEGQTHKDSQSQDRRVNGTSSASGAGKSALKKPANAFELYCADARPALEAKAKDDDDAAATVDAELARGWTELPQEKKSEYESQSETAQATYKKAKEDESAAAATAAANLDADGAGEDTPAAQDEDVEMGNYDTEAEAEAEAEAEGRS